MDVLGVQVGVWSVLQADIEDETQKISVLDIVLRVS